MSDKKKKILDDGMEAPGVKPADHKPPVNNLAELIKASTWMAHFVKIQYDAFVRVGFSKAEALELCKANMGGYGGKKK